MSAELSKSGLDGGRPGRPNIVAQIHIRDRIKDLRRVMAKDLVPNPKNWRRHPKAQVGALRDLLTEVGYADALLARELPDGKLMLVDGHLRAETTPDTAVPVLVLDVSEEEADKILATLDPLASMAEPDTERLKALLATVKTESDAVQELLKRTAGERIWEMIHPYELGEVEVAPERDRPAPGQMEDRSGSDVEGRRASGHLW
jgi:hypothetical protein